VKLRAASIIFYAIAFRTINTAGFDLRQAQVGPLAWFRQRWRWLVVVEVAAVETATGAAWAAVALAAAVAVFTAAAWAAAVSMAAAWLAASMMAVVSTEVDFVVEGNDRP
jgi:hypothetical protein